MHTNTRLWLIASCPCAHRFYGDAIPGTVLCERIASYMHAFNLYWYMRYVMLATLCNVVVPRQARLVQSGADSKQLYCSVTSHDGCARPSFMMRCRILDGICMTLACATSLSWQHASWLSRLIAAVHPFRRPYGSAILLAAYDKTGPQLYHIEPSGVAHRYYGTAVGKGRQSVKNEVEKIKFDQITCREAVVEAAKM